MENLIASFLMGVFSLYCLWAAHEAKSFSDSEEHWWGMGVRDSLLREKLGNARARAKIVNRCLLTSGIVAVLSLACATTFLFDRL